MILLSSGHVWFFSPLSVMHLPSQCSRAFVWMLGIYLQFLSQAYTAPNKLQSIPTPPPTAASPSVSSPLFLCSLPQAIIVVVVCVCLLNINASSSEHFPYCCLQCPCSGPFITDVFPSFRHWLRSHLREAFPGGSIQRCPHWLSHRPVLLFSY